MQRNIFITATVAAVTIIAIAVFSWTLLHAVAIAPDDDGSLASASSSAMSAAPFVIATSSRPVRLVIPSLSIDANIQDVGVNASGAMRAPNNFTDVAWYEYGTVPGMLGSAVIDGHVDNGLALAGVFKHLPDIKIGDDVYMQEKDGSRLHFVVTDIEIYPYESVPTNLIFNQNDAARLDLITCEGIWVPAGKTYDHRLVVYTELSAR